MNKDELVTSVADAEEQTAAIPSHEGSSDEAGDESGPRGEGSDSSGDESNGSSGDGGKDASEITAPSIGPNTVIEHKPPEERLNHDEISDVDAMGLDKRRQVQGKRYGASPLKQAVVYGTAVAVIIGLGFGAKLLTDELDKPEPVTNAAPWSQPEAPQTPPREDIDFPQGYQTDPVEEGPGAG